MTIVAFHYTKDSIIAVTDGLISGSSARVIEENVKIFPFTPQYKIPLISLGRLNGFREYVGGDFCLAYAGNYTLISSIISEISVVMSRRLVLDRDGENGRPMLYNRTDEGQGLQHNSYWDDFNFSENELVDLSMNLIANIISTIVQKVCQDFTRNAMAQPNVELLIFGQEIINHNSNNRAQFISCKRCDYGEPELSRFSILPWRPFCFGDRTSSEELLQHLEGCSQFDNSQLTTDLQQAPGDWMTRSSAVCDNEKNRNYAIKEATLKLIAKETPTIGGSCTIAEATWSRKLQVTTISHSDVVAAVSD